MDLKKNFLTTHTKAEVNRIVSFIGKNEKRFRQLVDLYISGPYRITQRAAWPLSYCVQNHPELIQPHFKRILDQLKVPGIHDAVKRNTIRMFQFIEIPKKYHGKVAELCFQYLANPKEAVAIRAFSMTVLAQLATEHPDIKQELKIIIEDHIPYASAAFRSRARKVIKELN